LSGIEKMTEKESAHPSVSQRCELTVAATVNGMSSTDLPVVPQSSVSPIVSQKTTHDSSDSSIRQGDGQELPRSKSMVSIVTHFKTKYFVVRF
jgi:hypothetical protein